MPRVLFCVPDFPPATGGGPALFAALVEHWVDGGGEAVVYTSGSPAGEARPSPRLRVRRFRRRPAAGTTAVRVRGLAARVGPAAWRAAVGFPYRPLEGYRRFLAGAAAGSDGPFDLVVHGYLPHVHVMEPAARLARRAGIPDIAVPLLHEGLLSRHPERHVLGDGGAEVLRRARWIAVLTGAEVEPLGALGVSADRVRVTGAALDAARLPRPDVAAFARRHALSRPWLVQAGGLSADKGTLTAIDAQARRRRAGATDLLLLAGRPEPEVRDALARLPPTARAGIRLLETADRDDLQAALAGAAALVHPTRADAFGFLILEAWAHRVPVIVANSGGPGRLVRDGVDGRVVPPDDAAALATAVDDLLATPDRGAVLAATGEHRVREELTWERVFPRWRILLREALRHGIRA